MNIREFYNQTAAFLKKQNIDSPALTAGVLLCHVLKCGKAYLYTHSDEEISNENLNILNGSIQRLCEHEPIDYIIGERGFMNYTFKVGKGVLVPRPETEILVEKCYEFITAHFGQAEQVGQGEYAACNEINILDLCTGAGCIAVSLVKMLKERGLPCKAIGVDISEEALAYARENAESLGVDKWVKFISGDVFNLKECLKKDVKTFTVILTNPPYIPKNDIVKLDRKVKDHEPLCALDGGEDGMIFYKKIIPQAKAYLKTGGLLAFETGYGQCGRVRDLIEETAQYGDVSIYRDAAGLERVVTCRLI